MEILEPETYLVDPSHRQRVYGRHLYQFQKKCSSFKKTDCDCLIRNFGFADKQNRHKSFEEFTTAMKAAHEHHFNNHHYCSTEWCHFAKLPEDQWKLYNAQKGNKLRDAVKDKYIYEESKKIHERFTTPENLKMMHHEFDSQKNESLNKSSTTVAPKNMVFSKTNSLHDRIALVVNYDSLGYHETFSCIFQHLTNNDNYIIDPIMSQFAKTKDDDTKKRRERQQSPKGKRMRVKKRKATLQANRLQNDRAKKRGDKYGPGVAFMPLPTEESTNNVTAPIQPQKIPFCKSCQQYGHSHITFCNCPKNPKNITK